MYIANPYGGNLSCQMWGFQPVTSEGRNSRTIARSQAMLFILCKSGIRLTTFPSFHACIHGAPRGTIGSALEGSLDVRLSYIAYIAYASLPAWSRLAINRITQQFDSTLRESVVTPLCVLLERTFNQGIQCSHFRCGGCIAASRTTDEPLLHLGRISRKDRLGQRFQFQNHHQSI